MIGLWACVLRLQCLMSLKYAEYVDMRKRRGEGGRKGGEGEMVA